MSTILIGEDEPEVRGYFELALKCLGYGVELAEDGEEVLEYLRQNHQITAVLLDVMMPRKNGIETLREIRRIHSDLPVIMVSDASSTTTVVEAMRCGATDFLGKPVIHDDLKHALRKALQMPAMVSEDIAASKQTVFYGANDGMASIQRLLRTVAMSEAPVLILGETGSGKEVLARELHANSRRAGKPFLKLNCAALPSELVESELFGYERGAFTGAFQKKTGMFELANSGTILLDEIGDMDFKLQAKLLQVLQDQEFHRIGGKELIHVDVRVIAATHQDLERAIFNRMFREDLYYRLNVMSFRVPPLRERPNDIISLAEFLVRKYAEPGPPLSPILKQTLLAYPWPGNVRELDNIMRRLTVLQDQDVIIREIQNKVAQKATAISTVAVLAPAETAPVLDQVIKATHQAESNAILTALNATRWNRKQAAAILKIDYKALLYKMKKLGIEGGPPRTPMGRKSTGSPVFTASI
jgi:two-component system, NtrC family, response regulator AtoC